MKNLKKIILFVLAIVPITSIALRVEASKLSASPSREQAQGREGSEGPSVS